jgi:hypothetical protein
VNAPARFPTTLPTPARPLSVELAQLRDAFAGRTATLREVIEVLAGRAYELLMILLVLPFLLPVSLPGLSTPFGLAVAVIGLQLALGRLPWLPRRLLDRQLPPGFFTKVVGVTAGVVKFLERALRPRLLAVTGARWLNGLHLFVVVVAGLLLALPMPIPFTNTFPAWTILLLAAGLMQRDGWFVLGGYVVLVATAVFFALLGGAITEALKHALHWLGF